MRDRGEEVHEARSTEEFGDEDGGMALGFGGVDPLEGGAEDAGVTASFPQDSAAIAAHGDGFGLGFGF